MTVRFTQVSFLHILLLMKNAENRRILLEGLLNTRELGLYPVTVDGKQKRIKQGLLFRSGSPESITKADQKILENFNIKTTVDFRSSGEKKASFDFPSLAKKVNLPIDAGNLMGTLLGNGDWPYNNSPQKAEAEMIQLYTVLPVEALPCYRELFSLLADPSNVPLLFYCSAGKDRTGVASALILHALGAGKETIMENYLCSTENLRPYWEPFENSEPYLIPYYTVRESYLLSAFKAMEKYGGIDQYLTKELGADIHHLQNLYTE